jgi:hypothetical protein
VNIGSVKGIVYDSVYNFVLTSATVAVYRDNDSNLLQYSLPNSFGEFTVKSLPVGTGLRMVVTHVGYKSLVYRFSINNTKLLYDVGKINLLRKTEGDNELSEIVITPVRMNGDTLEFSASAFKMDKNATTEDLLRKLPGFTIWSDGDITFNGKKINSVLVEGKPFMGGDFATVTQNLPKDAIQKVQVYQQVNEKNPYDSTTNVNLKLEDDKKMGRFGKVSAGFGTDKRYAADGMMSAFNKNMQVSIVGAVNNINKTAGSAIRLIESSSFKGEGARIDYQPNFRMSGLNKPVAAGITFQYDFVPDPKWQNKKRVSADYFLNQADGLLLRNTQSHTYLGKDSLLTQLSGSSNSSVNTSQRLNAKYERNTVKYEFSLSATASLVNNQSINQSASQQESTGAGIINTNESKNESHRNNKNYNVTLDLRKNETDYNRVRPRRFNVSYELGVVDNSGRSLNITKFRSFTNSSANRDYSRLYEEQDAFSIDNNLTVAYQDLKRLIFGKKRLGNINIGFSSSVALHNNTYNDRVKDYDTTAKQYQLNNYLTNKRELDVLNVRPSLDFSRSFMKQLSNRYFKYLTFDLHIKGQYYHMQHRATQAVQNFNRSYNRFIPNATISYQNEQYGRYREYSYISYNTYAEYPGVSHIAPLIDSSNVLYIPKGNPNLRTPYSQTLSYNYNLTGLRSNKPYSLNVTIGVGKADDKIADSSFYDVLGRRTAYVVNADGYRFINANVNFRKSLKVKKNNTFQFTGNGNYAISESPNYLNSILNISTNNLLSGSIGLEYGFKDIVTIGANQQIDYSKSKQAGFNNNVFENVTLATGFSGALQFPKNVTWSSNVIYNQGIANGQEPVRFTIWNAGLTCRFLKGNRGEVKFSALDMLRQNKSIINTAEANRQTFGYTNVLQHYFMLTLSYYPRKFGK